MWNEEKKGYDVRDSMRGIVRCCTESGVFLELENGQGAYATFGSLPRGTTVFCTVLKKPTDRFLTLVAVDSVLRSIDRAA